MKVSLRNPSRVTSGITTHNTSDNKVYLDRSIYQRLGSLLKNKTILDDYNNGRLPKEFVKFLDIMNEINEGTAETEVIALDELLGSFGENIDYSYSKDFMNIANWLGEFDEYFGYRNVSSGSSNVVYGDKNVTYTQGYTDG